MLFGFSLFTLPVTCTFNWRWFKTILYLETTWGTFNFIIFSYMYWKYLEHRVALSTLTYKINILILYTNKKNQSGFFLTTIKRFHLVHYVCYPILPNYWLLFHAVFVLRLWAMYAECLNKYMFCSVLFIMTMWTV